MSVSKQNKAALVASTSTALVKRGRPAKPAIQQLTPSDCTPAKCFAAYSKVLSGEPLYKLGMHMGAMGAIRHVVKEVLTITMLRQLLGTSIPDGSVLKSFAIEDDHINATIAYPSPSHKATDSIYEGFIQQQFLARFEVPFSDILRSHGTESFYDLHRGYFWKQFGSTRQRHLVDAILADKFLCERFTKYQYDLAYSITKVVSWQHSMADVKVLLDDTKAMIKALKEYIKDEERDV